MINGGVTSDSFEAAIAASRSIQLPTINKLLYLVIFSAAVCEVGLAALRHDGADKYLWQELINMAHCRVNWACCLSNII